MMQIEIAAAQPYTVSIGHGLLEQVGASIARLIPKGHAALISDDIVYPLYGECVSASLYGAGFVVSRYVLPHGEEHKKLVTVEGILDFLCASGISRGDFLVALGGGVMGDMAGLAAALYLRGIAYFQVPTTLLAAVDAAVGGKTAVNLGWGKNLAGAFHQPGGVFCDCDTFATLPAAIFADGVAEVIKYGMIADRELFEMAAAGKIASNIDAVVARSVSIKSDFINDDEYDRGKRQILNFGHTFAHGLEQVSDYRISHGRAVGVGMVMIAQAAYRLGLVP
ncbi:MAG: 3-dehydroquinate synthase family protein, partial [Clostridiales bacterium]